MPAASGFWKLMVTSRSMLCSFSLRWQRKGVHFFQANDSTGHLTMRGRVELLAMTASDHHAPDPSALQHQVWAAVQLMQDKTTLRGAVWFGVYTLIGNGVVTTWDEAEEVVEYLVRVGWVTEIAYTLCEQGHVVWSGRHEAGHSVSGQLLTDF